MEKNITLKFKARNVDTIEQAKKMSIENVLGDTTMNNLTFIVSKAFVNDEGKIGCSKDEAMNQIDTYLDNYDKEELVLDITEALVNGGFLPKELNVQAMREQKKENAKKINEAIKNA